MDDQTQSPYAKPGAFLTKLPAPDEAGFQQWVQAKKIPFEDTPTTDYDMRGYYKDNVAGSGGVKTKVSSFDGMPHFPDTYKTPYHKTFSNESRYATVDAPHWEGDRLISKDGKVVADETPVQNQSSTPAPFIPANPLMGSGQMPQMQAPQAPPVQQAPPPPDPNAVHDGLFGKAAKALMGHDTSYAVGPDGKMVSSEAPQKPGALFRNILAASILGGAAGAAGDPRKGFLGGLVNGGAASIQDSRNQDLLKRQQAEQDFQSQQKAQQMQLAKNQDQREESAAATQDTLRKAQIAGANAETYRTNMLTQGASFDQHNKVAENGKQHFSDYDAADLKPVFKSVAESDMQDLIKNRPGASTYDWEATGVKTTLGPDGQPHYEYTYSAYDPKGKIPVSAGTIAQWKKDGMEKYHPELFNMLKPGKEIDAQAYIELKKTDATLFNDNHVRQKTDSESDEAKARIKLQNAQAAHAFAEASTARLQGETIKDGKTQAQAFSKALDRLNEVGGDVSKLAPKDKVLIGESASKLLTTMNGEVRDILTADPSDSSGSAHKIMAEMDSVRHMATSAFLPQAPAATSPSGPAASFTFNGQTFQNIPADKVQLFMQTHPGAKPLGAPAPVDPLDAPQPGDNSSSKFYRHLKQGGTATGDNADAAAAGAYGG